MMSSRFIGYFIVVSLMIGCSSASKEAGAVADPVAAVETPSPTAHGDIGQQEAGPADSDTVDSLSKDVDKLQRELIQYSGLLTPKQEDEVETIKNKIQKKETKKANMELKKMLGELKEEE